MEFIEYLAKPQIIGPLIGLTAVVGWVIVTVAKRYFEHQERMEKIRMGMDPDIE
ncbi:MAG: hypothetical protein KJO69_07520 [Gammaproteobacteria bacterium]|nr:hypothetical protein [Gammaproteobacteria bacterium]NNJ72592.1 hypothetical protein [Enterobacterales bacterium]